MKSAPSTIAEPLSAMSCGVIENFLRRDRRAFGRVRATFLPHALAERPTALGPHRFVASPIAILLPAISRADDDCPSRVSSSLVATDELGGGFHVRDLPPFQLLPLCQIGRRQGVRSPNRTAGRNRAAIAIERGSKGRRHQNFHGRQSYRGEIVTVTRHGAGALTHAL